MVYNDQLYIVTSGIANGDAIVTTGDNANVALVLNAPTDVYGNAMMEWGQNGKKIWYKIVPDSGDTHSASIYVADMQVDNDYHCWSFYDKNNNIKDHFYTAIYNSMFSTVSPTYEVNKRDNLRSVSMASTTTDVRLMSCSNMNESVTRLNYNNQGSTTGWHFDTFADTLLINILLILMGKSLDIEEVYGKSKITTGLSGSTNRLPDISGVLDDKGMFWGSDELGQSTSCKVFGMENFYGNMGRWMAGLIVNRNSSSSSSDWKWKYKLTRGTADGSAATDYNDTGSNYLAVNSLTVPSSGSISQMTYLTNGAFLITGTSGALGGALYKADLYNGPGTSNYYAIRNARSDSYIMHSSATVNFSKMASASSVPLVITGLTYR
jgi:hypothetical protein